jgi:hypothetical protein
MGFGVWQTHKAWDFVRPLQLEIHVNSFQDRSLLFLLIAHHPVAASPLYEW